MKYTLLTFLTCFALSALGQSTTTTITARKADGVIINDAFTTWTFRLNNGIPSLDQNNTFTKANVFQTDGVTAANLKLTTTGSRSTDIIDIRDSVNFKQWYMTGDYHMHLGGHQLLEV